MMDRRLVVDWIDATVSALGLKFERIRTPNLNDDDDLSSKFYTIILLLSSQCSVSVARILYPTPHSSTNYFTRGASWRIQGDSSQRWSLESLLCVCSDAIVWHRGLKNKINKTLRKKKFEAINLGIRKLFKKFFWDFQKTHFLPFQKWQTNQLINSI